MSKANKTENVTSMVKKDASDRSFSSQVLARLEDMEQRFEHLLSSNWLSNMWGRHKDVHLTMPFEGRLPRVDIIDQKNDIVLKAELPGVKKEDIDVSLNDNYVTVKGSTHSESREEKGDYYRSEISSGSFCRTMALPSAIDVDSCKAKFKNGMLELTMPKTEKAKKTKIEIK